MTARDPFSAAAENEAARISARVEQRLRELECRPQDEAGNSASFTRAANRLCELRPVQLGLTLALERGQHAYITTVNGIPVAYTKDGWFTQEQADAKIAAQGRATRMTRPAAFFGGRPCSRVARCGDGRERGTTGGRRTPRRCLGPPGEWEA